MLRAKNDTHRPPTMQKHRARPAAETKREEEPTMESYRTQIIAMLDTIQDAKLMRMLYDVIKAVMMNR